MLMRLKQSQNYFNASICDVRTSEIKLQLNNAVGNRLKRSPDRRQFCFISVLFHDVRRAIMWLCLIIAQWQRLLRCGTCNWQIKYWVATDNNGPVSQQTSSTVINTSLSSLHGVTTVRLTMSRSSLYVRGKCLSWFPRWTKCSRLSLIL